MTNHFYALVLFGSPCHKDHESVAKTNKKNVYSIVTRCFSSGESLSIRTLHRFLGLAVLRFVNIVPMRLSFFAWKTVKLIKFCDASFGAAGSS